MNEIFTIIEIFVKAILEDYVEIDEAFIEELLEQGIEEAEIEQAFTILYNLIVNRKIPNEFEGSYNIRYFTDEEQLELGSEICSRLMLLQIYGLLSPTDLDYLIYGYFETRTGMGLDGEEFWELFREYRPELSGYLSYLEQSENAHFLIN